MFVVQLEDGIIELVVMNVMDLKKQRLFKCQNCGKEFKIERVAWGGLVVENTA